MNLPTRQWCLLRRLPSIFYTICSQYTDWRSVKRARSSLVFFNFWPKAFNWPSAVLLWMHHQKKLMTVAKTFFKGQFSPYLAFWTIILERACSTHQKICDKKNFRYDVASIYWILLHHLLSPFTCCNNIDTLPPPPQCSWIGFHIDTLPPPPTMFLNRVSHHWIVNSLHNVVLGQISVFFPLVHIQSATNIAETLCPWPWRASLTFFSTQQWSGEGKRCHPFPSTDYLSALFARRYFFFHPRQFLPFSPNSEPSPRLLHYPSNYMLKQAPSLLVENKK